MAIGLANGKNKEGKYSWLAGRDQLILPDPGKSVGSQNPVQLQGKTTRRPRD
jgi:hypothetical protein